MSTSLSFRPQRTRNLPHWENLEHIRNPSLTHPWAVVTIAHPAGDPKTERHQVGRYTACCCVLSSSDPSSPPVVVGASWCAKAASKQCVRRSQHQVTCQIATHRADADRIGSIIKRRGRFLSQATKYTIVSLPFPLLDRRMFCFYNPNGYQCLLIQIQNQT